MNRTIALCLILTLPGLAGAAQGFPLESLTFSEMPKTSGPAPATPRPASEIAFSCDFIDEYCELETRASYAKAGYRSCGWEAFPAAYVAQEKADCKASGYKSISVEMLSDKRWKAWLLTYVGDAVLERALRPSEESLRGLLDAMTQAVVPLRDEASVRRRLNEHVLERLILTETYMKLIHGSPKLGNAYMRHLYALSLYDWVDDVRARTMDFLNAADGNRANVERLVRYHARTDAPMVFEASASGGKASWRLVPKKKIAPLRNSHPQRDAQWLMEGRGGGLYDGYRRWLRSGNDVVWPD